MAGRGQRAGRVRIGAVMLDGVRRAARRGGGEIAGLPEQQDLFQPLEDAREEGRDEGVQGCGQHSSVIV